MKKIVIGMVVFCMAVGIFTVKVMADGIKEGKWTMTMTSKMEGLPPEDQAAMQQMQNLPPQAQAMMQKMNVQMSGGPNGMTTTVTRCITNQNPVPKSDRAEKENCKEDHTVNGNTVDFTMNCDNQGFQMQSSGHMTYSGDSMSGEIKSHQVAGGRNMDSTIDISGQYIGPCS